MPKSFRLFTPAYTRGGSRAGSYIYINDGDMHKYTLDEIQQLLEQLAEIAIDNFLSKKRQLLRQAPASTIKNALMAIDIGTSNYYLTADKIISVLAAEAARPRTHQVAIAHAINANFNEEKLIEIKKELYPIATEEDLINQVAYFFNDHRQETDINAIALGKQIVELEEVCLLFDFADDPIEYSEDAQIAIEATIIETKRQEHTFHGPR